MSALYLTGCGESHVPGQSGGEAGPEIIDGLPVSRTSGIMKFDPASPEALAEFSDEIFIGTVIRKVETTYLDEEGMNPLTVYEVRLGESLDGETPRTTFVGFEGGVTEAGDELVLPEGDSLLKAGEQYLFAGKRMEDGTLDLVPNLGTDELTSDSDVAATADKYRTVGD